MDCVVKLPPEDQHSSAEDVKVFRICVFACNEGYRQPTSATAHEWNA